MSQVSKLKIQREEILQAQMKQLKSQEKELHNLLQNLPLKEN